MFECKHTAFSMYTQFVIMQFLLIINGYDSKTNMLPHLCAESLFMFMI